MTAEEILERGDYLAHFNPFHNPKNGQFAKKNGTGVKSVVKKAAVGAAIAGVTFGAARAVAIPTYYAHQPNIGKIPFKIASKSVGIATGRAAIAGALAVIGSESISHYKKAVKNQNGKSS